jgi:YD repeat-containing protein
VAQFVCVDGSNATLSVPGDLHEDPGDWLKLSYSNDATEHDVYVNDDQQLNLNGRTYDPAELNLDYTLITVDGIVFQIDSTTAQLISITDANGNTTSYDGGAIHANGFSLELDRTGPGGTIRSARVVDQAGQAVGAPVVYEVDPVTLNLRSVTSRENLTETYGYDTAPARPHHLTSITDARGVQSMKAEYDETGRLKSLTDVYRQTATVRTSGLGGNGMREVSTDLTPQRNTVESIYNERGDVVREIRSIKDAAGPVTGYSVLVRDYSYFHASVAAELSNIFIPRGEDRIRPGASNQASLSSMLEWEAFVIEGADLQGERYTKQPSVPSKAMEYYTAADNPSPNDSNLRLPSRAISYLGHDDSGNQVRRVTTYEDYKAARPQKITVRVEVVDGNGRVVSSRLISQAESRYDDAGNLTYGKDSAGEETFYEYTNAENTAAGQAYEGLPRGLLLRAWKVRPGGDPSDPADQITLTRNAYYRETDTALGKVQGQLESTTDAAGLTVRYTYSPDARVRETWRSWTEQPPAGPPVPHDVRNQLTEYDAAGRVWKVTTPSGVVETVYGDTGQVIATVDALGAETVYTYDARGNLIRTHYPDGTETRTAYDEMGRPVWETERFASTTRHTLDRAGHTVTWQANDNTTRAPATFTVYDSLGRVQSTVRYDHVLIPIEDDRAVQPAAGHYVLHSAVPQAVVAGTAGAVRLLAWDAATRAPYKGPLAGLALSVSKAGGASSPAANAPSVRGDGTVELLLSSAETSTTYLRVTGTTTTPGITLLPLEVATRLLSSLRTVYDDAGHSVESVENDTLRFGTLYCSCGRVVSSGPLEAGAPADWFETDDPSDYYMTRDGKSLATSYAYEELDPETGELYDAATDPRGLTTRTYQDGLGRVVRTLWDNGTPSAAADDSSVRTLYGVNSLPVDGVELPAGLQARLAAGGRHVVKFDENDRPTHYVYDVSGRLTDVWLPKVKDPEDGNREKSPHWAYSYDSNGNQLTQTDPKGRVTRFEYDEYGRRISRTLPAAKDYAGGDMAQALERSFYDALGRLRARSDFAGNLAVYTFDDHYDDPAVANDVEKNLGRLLWETVLTKARVNQLLGLAATDDWRSSPDVDLSAVLTSADDPATTAFGARVEYGYDSLGRRDSVRDRSDDNNDGAFGAGDTDRRTRYTFDRLSGGVDLEAWREGAEAAEVVVRHAYDDATGRLIRTWTDATETAYGYDELGRLEHAYEVMANGTRFATYVSWDPTSSEPTFTGGTPGVTTYAYDPAGSLKTTTYDNRTPGGGAAAADDLAHQYAYDVLGRLDTLTVTRGGVKVFRQDFNFETDDHIYEYQLDGRRGGVVETRYDDNGVENASVRIDWDYDALGHLIRETYDSSDNATDYNAVYEYDLAGNRVSKVQTGFSQARITYAYNDRDQLVAEGPDNDGDRKPDAAGATTYDYNANGSMTRKGSDTFGWDVRNRMTSATVAGSATRYTYDHRGQRLSQRTGTGTTTYYVNDNNNPTGFPQVLEERKGSTPGTATVDRSYMIGLTVEAQAGGNGAFHLVRDGRGSVRALLNADRKVVEKYDFQAFGEPAAMTRTDPVTGATSILTAKTAATIHLFGGDAEFDASTGMYYHDARWRDGARFVSFDTYEGDPGRPLDLHKYAYALSSPVGMADPSGHNAFGVAVSAVFGFVSLLMGVAGAMTLRAIEWGAKHPQIVHVTVMATCIAFMLTMITAAAIDTGAIPPIPYLAELGVFLGIGCTLGLMYQSILPSNGGGGGGGGGSPPPPPLSGRDFARTPPATYRGDGRSPGQIKAAGGFNPRGTNMNLDDLLDGLKKDSGYVATTVRQPQAERFARQNRPPGGSTYVYSVKPPPDRTVNVDQVKGIQGEAEFAVKGNVPWDKVRGWQEIPPSGPPKPFTPNPDFVEDY